MSKLFKNGEVYFNQKFQKKDFIVDDSGCMIIADSIDLDDFEEIFDCSSLYIVPSFIYALNNNLYLKDSNIEIKKAIKGGYNSISTILFEDTYRIEDVKKIEKRYNLSCDATINPILSLNSNTELSENYFLYHSNTEEKLETLIKKCNENDGILSISFQSINELDSVLNIVNGECKIHISNVKNQKAMDIIKNYRKNNHLIASVNLSEVLDGEEKDFLIEMVKAEEINEIDFSDYCDLEFAFGLLYTRLVKEKKITLEVLCDLLSYNPAFNVQINGGEIKNLESANFSIFDLQAKKKITNCLKSSYNEKWIMGICLMNVVDGIIVYNDFR
ncbi:MAG: hypothetical protein ACK5KQ_05645 [Anaerorhabdus sp.]